MEVALHDAQSVEALAQWPGELGGPCSGELSVRTESGKREEQTALSRQECTFPDRLGKKTAGSEATPVSAGHEKGRSRCLSNRLICGLFTGNFQLMYHIARRGAIGGGR